MPNNEVVKKSDITILVNSCDYYEDAWNPFFRLLKIQWPQCEDYDIVLNTENKTFDCDYLNIRTFCGGKGKAWSGRLLDCLETIDSEYVFFFLEDEFLYEPVNVSEFEKAMKFLNDNKDVGVLYPHKNKKQTMEIDEDYFSRDLMSDARRLVCICAIWRKDFLIKMLKEDESPWDFEANAPTRSKQHSDRILQYNNALPGMIFYDDQIDSGYGITEKKWYPRTKTLLDKYGITVNYNNLGFYPYENQQEAQEAKRKQRKREQKVELNPIEILYNIKKKLKGRK